MKDIYKEDIEVGDVLINYLGQKALVLGDIGGLVALSRIDDYHVFSVWMTQEQLTSGLMGWAVFKKNKPVKSVESWVSVSYSDNLTRPNRVDNISMNIAEDHDGKKEEPDKEENFNDKILKNLEQINQNLDEMILIMRKY